MNDSQPSTPGFSRSKVLRRAVVFALVCAAALGTLCLMLPLPSGTPEAGKGAPTFLLFQDYDWADEVLHARVGRDWYVSQFENPKEAVEWGDRAWSKVLIGWRQWKDEGLTEHRNWWPDVYLDWCRVQNLTPDEKVLAFSESYETKRADLKILSASA